MSEAEAPPAAVPAPALLHILGAIDARRVLVARSVDAAPGALVEVSLSGAFAWRVSGERHCVGSWVDGAHVPCPTQAEVGAEATCPPCSGLEDPECVFEPRCQTDPTSCHCAFGPVPHVVYAAFYGTLPKVGMTQAWRLERRLREQGADAYFVVAERASRAEARATERQVAFLHRIPEWRTPREVLPQLARPVEWDVLEARAASLRERLADRFPGPGPLVRVTDHPVAQPLGSVPYRVRPWGRHAGTWLGSKGQNLFYEVAPGPGRLGPGAIAALKRSDLMGRTLTLG